MAGSDERRGTCRRSPRGWREAPNQPDQFGRFKRKESAMQSLPILGPQPTLVASEATATKGTYAFVSLGCPKNLIDSEKMLGHLAIDGYALVSEPAGADFVIVNTCGFIESSRAESKAVIQEMLDLKKQGKTRGVIV